MSPASHTPEFRVSIRVQVAGPVRPRTKYKKHKLLTAEKSVTLPFVPYPGILLTFSQPRKRGVDRALYLRIRAVEWNVTEERFECITDEVLSSMLFWQTMEVRGGARSEQQFVDIQKLLRNLEFDVQTNVEGHFALHKDADGTLIESR